MTNRGLSLLWRADLIWEYQDLQGGVLDRGEPAEEIDADESAGKGLLRVFADGCRNQLVERQASRSGYDDDGFVVAPVPGRP